MSDEVVVVRTVADEMAAEVVCGLLRAAGIECGHRVTEEVDSALHGLSSDGPRVILVREDDAEAARAVVADSSGG